MPDDDIPLPPPDIQAAFTGCDILGYYAPATVRRLIAERVEAALAAERALATTPTVNDAINNLVIAWARHSGSDPTSAALLAAAEALKRAIAERARPVPDEPVAWLRPSDGDTISAEDKRLDLFSGYQRTREHAAGYSVPLYTQPASAQETAGDGDERGEGEHE